MYSFSRLFAGLILLCTVYGLVGCAGSGASKSNRTEAGDTAASADSSRAADRGLHMITLNGASLEYTLAARGESTPLTAADRVLDARAVSPDNSSLAVTYAVRDSSKLALIDLETRSIRDVHSAPGRMVYSLSWAPDGHALAFGYYRPAGDGEMGRGGVSIASAEGTVRTVGCRAAAKVLKWLPDGRLAVRDNDNLYVVESDGCGTVSTLDVRKMYHITYSPDGRRMAYILRDLVYDRQSGEYVPDSTLYLADARGNNPNELFDDEYRARHLRWSPEGTRLAFDVRSKHNRDRRQIIIYDVSSDRLTYLIPPQVASSQDEIQPRWSPEGDHVAFTQVGDGARHAAVQVMGQTRTLGRSQGPVWGWAGRDHLVFPAADSTRIVNLAGTQVHGVPNERQLLHAWTGISGSTGAAGEASDSSE